MGIKSALRYDKQHKDAGPQNEEELEYFYKAANSGQAQDQEPKVHAAGVILLTPQNHVLLLQRSDKGDHPNEWNLPGGGIEEDETPEGAALRECVEETGYLPDGELKKLDQRTSDEGVDYTTFIKRIPKMFEPKINDEHKDAGWHHVDDLADLDLHPGLLAVLEDQAGKDQDKAKDAAKFEEESHPRDADGKFTTSAGGETLNAEQHLKKAEEKSGDPNAPMWHQMASHYLKDAEKEDSSGPSRKSFVSSALGRAREAHQRVHTPKVIVSGEGPDQVKLYHGTTKAGAEGIRASGGIREEGYFTDNKSVALKYAGGDPKNVFEVSIPKEYLGRVGKGKEAYVSVTVPSFVKLSKSDNSAEDEAEFKEEDHPRGEGGKFARVRNAYGGKIENNNRYLYHFSNNPKLDKIGIEPHRVDKSKGVEGSYGNKAPYKRSFFAGPKDLEDSESYGRHLYQVDTHHPNLGNHVFIKNWGGPTGEYATRQKITPGEHLRKIKLAEALKNRDEPEPAEDAEFTQNDKPYAEGEKAWHAGKRENDNPYPRDSQDWFEWDRAFFTLSKLNAGKLHGDKAADMTPEEWQGLRKGLNKFLDEEEREPEHAEGKDTKIGQRLARLNARRTGQDEDSDEEFGVGIDDTHDGPWMSCMSKDGQVMYRNKNVPREAMIDEAPVDVNDMLLHHEVPEWKKIQELLAEFKKEKGHEPDEDEREKIYLDAHNSAGTPSERRRAKQLNVDWKGWSAWCRGQESKLEKGPFKNEPEDADVRVAPHRHGDLEVTEDSFAQDIEWVESDHPRDAYGKFGSGGGRGGSTEAVTRDRNSSDNQAFLQFSGEKDFRYANAVARGDDKKLSSSNRRVGSDLKERLDKAWNSVPPLLEDKTLLRGVYEPDKTMSVDLTHPENMVGKSYVEGGWISTTTSRSVATGFAESKPNRNLDYTKGAILEINVPKGTRALDFGTVPQPKDVPSRNEGEFILPRGGHLTVTGFEPIKYQVGRPGQKEYMRGRTVILKIDYVPQKEFYVDKPAEDDAATFKEADHPREKSGKFTSGGGSSFGSAAPTKSPGDPAGTKGTETSHPGRKVAPGSEEEKLEKYAEHGGEQVEKDVDSTEKEAEELGSAFKSGVEKGEGETKEQIEQHHRNIEQDLEHLFIGGESSVERHHRELREVSAEHKALHDMLKGKISDKDLEHTIAYVEQARKDADKKKDTRKFKEKFHDFISQPNVAKHVAHSIGEFVGEHAVGIAHHTIRKDVVLPVIGAAVADLLPHLGLMSESTWHHGGKEVVMALTAYTVSELMGRFGLTSHNMRKVLVTTTKALIDEYNQNNPPGTALALKRAHDAADDDEIRVGLERMLEALEALGNSDDDSDDKDEKKAEDWGAKQPSCHWKFRFRKAGEGGGWKHSGSWYDSKEVAEGALAFNKSQNPENEFEIICDETPASLTLDVTPSHTLVGRYQGLAGRYLAEGNKELAQKYKALSDAYSLVANAHDPKANKVARKKADELSKSFGIASDAGWEEGKHKRGQPENKGQFASGSGGGGGGSKPSAIEHKFSGEKGGEAKPAYKPGGKGEKLEQAAEAGEKAAPASEAPTAAATPSEAPTTRAQKRSELDAFLKGKLSDADHAQALAMFDAEEKQAEAKKQEPEQKEPEQKEPEQKEQEQKEQEQKPDQQAQKQQQKRIHEKLKSPEVRKAIASSVAKSTKKHMMEHGIGLLHHHGMSAIVPLVSSAITAALPYLGMSGGHTAAAIVASGVIGYAAKQLVLKSGFTHHNVQKFLTSAVGDLAQSFSHGSSRRLKADLANVLHGDALEGQEDQDQNGDDNDEIVQALINFLDILKHSDINELMQNAKAPEEEEENQGDPDEQADDYALETLSGGAYPVNPYALDEFKEADHPRGQPENAGQFTSGSGTGQASLKIDDKIDNANIKQAVISYVGHSGPNGVEGVAYSLNRALREGKELNSREAWIAKQLDTAFSKIEPTKKPMKLYRGLSGDLYKDGGVEPGYTSATSSLDEAGGMAGSKAKPGDQMYVYEIEVPKGSKVLRVANFLPKGHEFLEEKERMLPRGAKFERVGEPKPLPGYMDTHLVKLRYTGSEDEINRIKQSKDSVVGDSALAFDAVEKFALDKKTSVRELDADGRLHVKVTNISKANICPYIGREIPNAEELGLDLNKIYYLLRDPKELKKAAPTFNGIQLLMKHTPVSADDPKQYDVVGCTGTDAEFVDPYLRNSLVVWTADAIELIDSGEQKELSCAYRYTADMTPGKYKGEYFDGRMTAISGNHLAVVVEGRVGKDIFVADSSIGAKEAWRILEEGLLELISS